MTLFEMLLVIAILAMATGFIGINVSKALTEQRFQTEVKLVVDQLRLAQDLMLIFNTSVHFKIVGSDEGLVYGLEFDQELPKSWSKELQRVHKPLRTIHAFNFDDQTFHEGNGDVRFLSGGALMSRGMIRLATSQSAGARVLERFICLPGYPAPIEACTAENVQNNKRDASFDEQLTARTYEEVQAQVSGGE